MNRLLLVLTILLLPHVTYCGCLSTQTRDREEKLKLLYELNPISPASFLEPVELYITAEGNLRIQFIQDLGEVTIQIIDSNYTSYYESLIHSDYEKDYNIESSHFPIGEYTIYLQIEDDSLYAQFRIK